ncbi:hypothetical protein FRX31_021338 [Thalictrum thalictroides]|uniref:DUF4283 domain-containing protein n=1 Tax=Thalictrum thalictroides TaxID=46969 RepID=A0A7J6VXM7_THATH|nr:hypothetical protein FRX31_021338 [Thalictrum thalictroides]
MVDWEWVKKRVEDIVGVVDIKILGETEAVIDTMSRELAWKLENVKAMEGYGGKVIFRRWSPECGGLMQKEMMEKNRWVYLRGVPFHLRFEEAIKKMMYIFCQEVECDMNHTGWWRKEQIRVRTKGVKLEDIPRVIYVEERGYRFPIEIVLEEEVVSQRAEEKHGQKYDEGDVDRKIQGIGVESSIGGDNDSVIQELGKTKSTVHMVVTKGGHVETPTLNNNLLGSNWTKVTGNSKPMKSTETRTWAEIVKTNHYEGFEVVDLEAKTAYEKQACEVPEPSHHDKPKTNGTKLGPASSFNSGCPSLKLSRRLWPNQKTGRKDRLSRVKRLARKALEKESLRNNKNSKEQQVVDYATDQYDSEDSISSPMGDRQEALRKGKAIQLGDVGAEVGKNKVWVKKEAATDTDKDVLWDGPPGLKRKTASSKGVNFAQLINQECGFLRSEEEVNDWVGNIIDPITKQLKLSTANGEEAVRNFFKQLGYAKLR